MYPDSGCWLLEPGHPEADFSGPGCGHGHGNLPSGLARAWASSITAWHRLADIGGDGFADPH